MTWTVPVVDVGEAGLSDEAAAEPFAKCLTDLDRRVDLPETAADAPPRSGEMRIPTYVLRLARIALCNSLGTVVFPDVVRIP